MIIDVLWKILQNLEPPSDLASAFFLFFLAGFFSDGFDLGLSESSKNVYEHYYHFFFEF